MLCEAAPTPCPRTHECRLRGRRRYSYRALPFTPEGAPVTLIGPPAHRACDTRLAEHRPPVQSAQYPAALKTFGHSSGANGAQVWLRDRSKAFGRACRCRFAERRARACRAPITPANTKHKRPPGRGQVWLGFTFWRVHSDVQSHPLTQTASDRPGGARNAPANGAGGRVVVAGATTG